MDTLSVPNESSESAKAYAILGRALALASSFEADCRVVAFALGLKEPNPISGDINAFSTFLEKVVTAQLVKTHDRIISKFNLSEEYKDRLSDARDARNYIAHEAGEEIETKLRDQEEWAAWCQILREKLFEIAAGKQIVAVLITRVVKSTVPSVSSLSAYPAHIIQ
jgi:hypothetical protein